MSFSRLLLVAANSKKCIWGEGDDKVCISHKSSKRSDMDPYEGEVILCFQLDDRTDEGKRTAPSIGILEGDRRCDGLIFYSQDDKTDKVICLVEMKSTNIARAKEQILATKSHIKELLLKECDFLPGVCHADCRGQIAHITWKACLYHHSASQDEIGEFQRELRNHGFQDVECLDRADNDLRPLLSGVGRSAREMAKKWKNARKRRR